MNAIVLTMNFLNYMLCTLSSCLLFPPLNLCLRDFLVGCIAITVNIMTYVGSVAVNICIEIYITVIAITTPFNRFVIVHFVNKSLYIKPPFIYFMDYYVVDSFILLPRIL